MPCIIILNIGRTHLFTSRHFFAALYGNFLYGKVFFSFRLPMMIFICFRFPAFANQVLYRVINHEVLNLFAAKAWLPSFERFKKNTRLSKKSPLKLFEGL